ncbi:MAG: GTPase ObgE [Fusobacteriaceae bacterium]|nr:GTPase ObgE [Fusobacteriaceae bacterium]
MFIDEVVITVKAGDGGDGSASLRREKFVQFGGPDGGDGGKGGDVIFASDPNLNTLIDFQYKKVFAARNGENGQKKQCNGKSGEDLVIRVPVGTQIRDFESGKLLLDLGEEGMQRVFLKGGAGGLGNTNFKSPTRQTPKLAGKGREGQTLKIKLELKLLADVALVGYPSVGKSSMINRISAARSKVAAYHFTTLDPKLGVVRLSEGQSFVVADIPGLIEGAHEGVGLGDQFLRHIERCKMICHLVDISGMEGRDPLEDYRIINRELSKFSSALAAKPQLVLANKTDLLPGGNEDPAYLAFRESMEQEGREVFPVSVLTGAGLSRVLYRCYELIRSIPRAPLEEETDVGELLREHRGKGEDFVITRAEDGVWVAEGRVIDDVLQKYVIHLDSDSLINFLHMMKSLGLEEALREAGVRSGDTVRIADVEYDYVE